MENVDNEEVTNTDAGVISKELFQEYKGVETDQENGRLRVNMFN